MIMIWKILTLFYLAMIIALPTALYKCRRRFMTKFYLGMLERESTRRLYAQVLLIVLLLFHFFRDLCSAFCREKDSYSRLHQAAVVAGMAGFMVQAMTDYSFYNYRVMFLFWVFIALGGLLARRGQLPERGRNM